MHHDTWNQENSVNLKTVTVSRPGEFSRVESIEADAGSWMEQPRSASPARAALHIPLSLPTTNLATSSSAIFTRTNGQEKRVQYTRLKLETRQQSTSLKLDTHGFAHGLRHQTQYPRGNQFREIFPDSKKSTPRKRSRFRKFWPDSKTGPREKNLVTGNYHLFR